MSKPGTVSPVLLVGLVVVVLGAGLLFYKGPVTPQKVAETSASATSTPEATASATAMPTPPADAAADIDQELQVYDASYEAVSEADFSDDTISDSALGL